MASRASGEDGPYCRARGGVDLVGTDSTDVDRRLEAASRSRLDGRDPGCVLCPGGRAPEERSGENVGVHRQDAGLDVVEDALGLRALGGGANGEEERQEVLVGR